MRQEFSASKAQYDPAGGKEVLICLQVTFYYFKFFLLQGFFPFYFILCSPFLVFICLCLCLFYPVINLSSIFNIINHFCTFSCTRSSNQNINVNSYNEQLY